MTLAALSLITPAAKACLAARAREGIAERPKCCFGPAYGNVTLSENTSSARGPLAVQSI